MSHKNTIEQSPSSNTPVSSSSSPFQTTNLIDTTSTKPGGKGLGDVLNSSPLSPADEKALSGTLESPSGKTPDEQRFEQQLPLAQAGNAAAQCYVGGCYGLGRGVEKDEAKAVEWYQKAAAQEHAQAQHNLGVCYEQGRGVTKNEVEAIEWYEKAAAQGQVQAQYNLGVFYRNGYGVAQDYAKAVEWYEKAAAQGYAKAQNNLGRCCELGCGVAKDEVKAVEWYEKAAKQGHAQAQTCLGWHYDQGRGVAQDYVKAVDWYEKAAAQGNADAQFNLGWCYEQGRGVAQDYVKAVEWYEKAAKQGHAGAQNDLGICYRQGLGVVKDEAKAVEWYEKAAAQGNADAQFNLGWCYANSRGVAQDYIKAVEWYEKAAKQGHAGAQNDLGICYRQGLGVMKDEAQAVEWCEKAAKQGHAAAQCNLGLCYEFGRGVAKDEAQAVAWYEKAVAQGHAPAQARLDEINRRKSTQASSALPKAEVKQGVSGDDTTDRETKESKQTNLPTEVSQLTVEIQQGETAALSKALTTPVAQQSEPLQNYVQSQAIWTVLESEAKPAQKAEQIALLVEAPGVSLLVENDQGQRPLDVALQQFAAGHINKAAVEKLQEATYRQLAEEEGEIFNAIEEYAKSVSTDVSDEKASSRPVDAKSMADPKDGSITPQQLAAEVQKLRKADEVLQQQFKAVSLPASQPSASPSSQPKQLSKQQRNIQKKLFQQMVQQLVSKKFIKSVGIGQGWVVEDVSMKKAATKAGITFVAGTVANVFLPGIGGAAVSGVKATAEAAEHRRQVKKSRKHTLGLTSLNQLAMVTSYIEQGLLHRYQDFLLQQNLLLPQKAMEILINCLIERMCLYVEKIDKAKEIIPLLGEKFVNLSKQKKTGQAVIPDVKFTDAVAAQVAENLVAGTSLLSLSRIGSLVDKVGSGTDALITCLTADGGEKELHVNDICHSPAVTLTADAEKASLEINTVADDLEYEGRHLLGSKWIVGECGVMCISREEAVVEELEEVTADWGSDGLPIMKAHSDVAKWLARAEAAEAEVVALKARVSELEQQLDDAELSQRSLGQQLLAMSEVVETAEAKEPKSAVNHRSKGGPGMFDSKLNAAGKPIKPLPPVSSFQPVSPKPKSGLPSTPTTPAVR